MGDATYWLMMRETTLSTGIVALIFIDAWMSKSPTVLPWLPALSTPIESWFQQRKVQILCCLVSLGLLGYQLWLVV
jgi:hypothetical protein